MLALFLGNRSRAQVINKFHKEEKMNAEKVELALQAHNSNRTSFRGKIGELKEFGGDEIFAKAREGLLAGNEAFKVNFRFIFSLRNFWILIPLSRRKKIFRALVVVHLQYYGEQVKMKINRRHIEGLFELLLLNSGIIKVLLVQWIFFIIRSF